MKLFCKHKKLNGTNQEPGILYCQNCGKKFGGDQKGFNLKPGGSKQISLEFDLKILKKWKEQ